MSASDITSSFVPEIISDCFVAPFSSVVTVIVQTSLSDSIITSFLISWSAEAWSESSECPPKIGAITRPIKQVSFIKIFIEGPEVSLNGSPTVSPVTAALWASEPL